MSISLSISGPSRQAIRGLATAAPAISSSPAPALSASLLLSRSPLLTPTPHPLAKAYYARSLRIRHALSNPPPTAFYFKPGSLPLRRFLQAEHATETAYYGAKIAGSAPDVGEVQPEPELVERQRGEWEAADSERGEKSLERWPEEELFCLVQQNGKWTFPSTDVKPGEGLDEAVRSRIVGVEGDLGGRTMDTWIVTRKPIGLVRKGETRNFFLRSHILAGEPNPSKASGYTGWAWLTASEVEARLRDQGDEAVWESVKGMFGIGIENDF